VGRQPPVLEREVDFATRTRSNNRDGRIQHRLGSILWEPTDRRPVVGHGGHKPHQLPGTHGSSAGNKDICQEQEEHSDPSEDGQHFRPNVHKQTGRYGISRAEPMHEGPLDLVSRKKHHVESNPSSPGSLNTVADEESRVMKDRSDWRLWPKMFHQINFRFGPLEVDLFASRLTAQLPKWLSWRPDPSALTTDAFSLNWSDMTGYANPPWNLIGRVLSQVRQQNATLILVTPVWRAQPWYPSLLELLIEEPILLPRVQQLIQPTHPVNDPDIRPQLAVWPISGQSTLRTNFHQRLRASSSHHGDTNLGRRMIPCSGNGLAGVLNGILIRFQGTLLA